MLEIEKAFWERRYKEIQNCEILKISMMLFIFGERLLKLHIDIIVNKIEKRIVKWRL